MSYAKVSSREKGFGRLRGNDGWGYPYGESLPVRSGSEGGQPLIHFDSFLIVIAGDGGRGVDLWPYLALFGLVYS